MRTAVYGRESSLDHRVFGISGLSGYAFGIAKTGFSSVSLRDVARGVSLDVTIKYACDSANRGG